MSIRYIQSGDEPAGSLLTGGQIDDGADSWWAGAQYCFASIALAAAVAASTLSAAVGGRLQQDPEEIPAGSLISPVDEDFWPASAGATTGGQSPVRPASPPSFQPLPYLPEPEEIPAGSLSKFSTPDEDFWSPCAAASGDGQPYVAQILQASMALYQRLPYLPDLSDDPAGSLSKFSTPDEDFWDNPLSPIATANYQRLPYQPDPEEIPALVGFISPDEDFWSNPLRAISIANFLPLPYLPDPSDEPAQFHWIELDWYADPTATSTVGYNIYRGTAGPGSEGSTPINPAPVDVGASANSPCTYNDCNIQWGVTYWYTVYSYDTSSGLQSSTPTNEISASYPPTWCDEDFWQNPVPPVPPGIYQPLPLVGFSDDPAGSLYGQPDEDFWINPVAPVPPALYQRLPLLDYSDEPAGSLYGQPEEDYWQNPVAPIPASLFQRLPCLPDPEELPAGSLKVFATPDEDFWENSVAPVPASIFQPLPIAVGEPAEIPPQTVLPPDEDFWQNAVFPAPALLFQRLPILPDLEEIPAGSLYGQADEDFWVSGVVPVAPAVYQRLPYLPEPEELPAGSLKVFATPDEDFWENPVAPVPASIFQPLPIAAGEPAEIPPQTVLPPDEDFWSPCAAASGNGQPYIAQILQASIGLYQRLPYLPDLSDDPAGSLLKFTSPDEDYWPAFATATAGGQNPIPPGLPGIYQPLPVAAGDASEIILAVAFQPDEDFWANPAAPIPPAVYQRLPYLPDLSDDPAGSLIKFSTPDEDFWLAFATATAGGQNPIPPGLPGVYQPLPIAAGDASEIIPAVAFQPDEDFWSKGVALPTFCRAEAPPRPYLPDLGDDPAGSFVKFSTPDEDFWPAFAMATAGGQNPIPPGLPGIYQALPICSGDTAEAFPPGHPDEDFWPPCAVATGGAQGLVTVTAPSLFQLLPYAPAVFGFDDFASYWWRPPWGVHTHSTARNRLSRSAARSRISRGVSRQGAGG
jgi:hypothetical protein